MFFQQFTGINTIIYYSPKIFKMAGIESNTLTILPAILLGAVNVLFTVVSIMLLDKLGRRPLYFIGMIGMIIALFGLILPILGDYSSFLLLLGSLLLLGTGSTILQVAGNPIMRDVSPEGKYSRNLSFGQFFKAIGSLSGALLPLLAAKYWGLDWKILFPIYSGLMLVAVIYLRFTKIEEKKDENASPASFSSVLKVLKTPYIFFMVLAIFLYVGAEVSMSAKLPNYLEHKFNFDIKELGLWGTLFFFLALMIGRFLGGIILNWMSPSKFLKITTLLALVGIMGLYFAGSYIFGFITIFIIGLGFANIFPLVFSITIDNMPERSNEISGLMVTAIIGGAFVPVIFGAIADLFSIMVGFIVPFICIAYVFVLAFYKRK